MKDEIMCRFDEDGSLELYDPYATIECETKEDYDSLVELVELGKSVVRCKDCMHWHENIGWCDKHSHFILRDGSFCHPWESTEWKMFDADYFCADGERRDSDATD